jgi:hypothetical protein
VVTLLEKYDGKGAYICGERLNLVKFEGEKYLVNEIVHNGEIEAYFVLEVCRSRFDRGCVEVKRVTDRRTLEMLVIKRAIDLERK